MGLIGDLLYPNNADEARELNADQQKLQKTNVLHNDFVQSYKLLADKISTFDAYLMAILVMQYHITYTKEDLENLPDTKMPKITKSLADKIETVALDALSVKMAYNGLKTIGRRIANVVREGGSYSESISEGPEAVAEDLTPELNSIATEADLVRSGNIDILTNTEPDAAELGDMASELGEVAEELGEVSEIAEEGGEIAETADSAVEGAAAAAEAAEGAAEATEVAAEAGAEAAAAGAGAGLSAILGPAAIILIVVTEVIGAINAGETHAKLEKALAQMKKLQSQSDKSLANIKKAFKSLLKSAKLDLQVYNKVLKKLYNLEKKDPVYDVSYKTDGIDSFINGIDAITINNTGGIVGFQQAVLDNINPAIHDIRNQATHDSMMTQIISEIKTHIRKTGNPKVGPDFLNSISAVEGVSLDKIQNYDKFRQYIAMFAAALAPFHQQISQNTPAGSKLPKVPKNPKFGKPNPDFDPKPSAFTVP